MVEVHSMKFSIFDFEIFIYIQVLHGSSFFSLIPIKMLNTNKNAIMITNTFIMQHASKPSTYENSNVY